MTTSQANRIIWATIDTLEAIEEEGYLDTLPDHEAMDIIALFAHDMFDMDLGDSEIMSLYRQTRKLFFAEHC